MLPSTNALLASTKSTDTPPYLFAISHLIATQLERSIQVFNAGSKKDEPEKYEGGRTASDIVSFAQNKAAESKPPPEVFEITAKDAFQSDCADQQV